jgi:autotransporter-associated beta strand protein
LGNKTLTVQGSTAGTGEIAGAIGNSAGFATSLTKAGTGAWVLSGSNNYSGATTITGGTLELRGSINGTIGVTAETGGTLLLSGGSERVVDTAVVALNSGVLKFADTLGATTENLGALSLDGESTIDFGLSLVGNTFQFDGLSLAGGFTGLTVLNWTGSTYLPETSTDNGSNTDKLLFDVSTGLTDTQLGQIRFFDDSGSFLGTAHQIDFNGSFEIVPVPEPSSAALLGAAGALALAGYRRRRARG